MVCVCVGVVVRWMLYIQDIVAAYRTSVGSAKHPKYLAETLRKVWWGTQVDTSRASW